MLISTNWLLNCFVVKIERNREVRACGEFELWGFVCKEHFLKMNLIVFQTLNATVCIHLSVDDDDAQYMVKIPLEDVLLTPF